MFQAVRQSKTGMTGALFILGSVIWTALAVWQAAEFLWGHMTLLTALFDSYLGPMVLLILGFAFLYRAVSARWSEIPRQRSTAPEAQDAGLDTYFAQMEQWLHGPDAPLNQKPPNETIRISAQERTIGTLPGLSPDGKRRVVRFLHRHELIKVGTAIISLAHADLSLANLSGLALQDSLLNGANLRDANLSDAGLCHYEPTGADWQRAFERGVLGSLSQPNRVSHLIGCDLSGAVLRGAHLAGCILRRTDFAGADLDEADIRAADLRRAENLTQRQIESAYGSHGQQGGTSDTLLPQGVKPPKLWERPLNQQKGVRRARSN
jgi:hypothetical protein